VGVAEVRRLLKAETHRWAHVAGVASAASVDGEALRIDEAELLVAAAWLHDIGYSADLLDTGFHPLDGVRYLRSTAFFA